MKKEKEKKNKVYIIIIIILVLLLIGAIIFILTSRNPHQNNSITPDSSADDYDGNHQTLQLADGTPGIAIAGQPESLVFKAGELSQTINIYNPSANNVLMLPSLYVDDVKVWEGGYLAPGKAYYTIDLDKPLTAGDYQAYILYECFREDGTALNNAKVQFKLIVK